MWDNGRCRVGDYDSVVGAAAAVSDPQDKTPEPNEFNYLNVYRLNGRMDKC